jgi:protein SDA1
MDKIHQAVQASQMRLLTDEDFRKIDAARLSKEVTAVKRGKKRPAEGETCPK